MHGGSIWRRKASDNQPAPEHIVSLFLTIMVSPADMILFAAVVREGSFTRAAARLGITKQTASERVAKLEEALGVRLLERTTRRLRVTDAGGPYAERCAAIASAIADANREVQRAKREPTGVIRVSAPRLYGRRYLGTVIATFCERHPRMRVELVLADHRVQLIEEGLDVAIRIGELDDSSLSARKLGEASTYHVASPAYLARHGLPTRELLARARCITMRPQEVWTIDGRDVKIDPVLVVNDLEVACEAAVAGVGIARLPGIVCRDAVSRGALVILSSMPAALVREVHAVFPSRRHLSAAVRAFLDLLSELVQPMAPLDAPARA